MKLSEIYEVEKDKVYEAIDKRYEGRNQEYLIKQKKEIVDNVVQKRIGDMTELKGEIKEIFFHTKGSSTNMYILIDGHCLVMPVSSECLVCILSPKGLKADVTEFKKDNETTILIVKEKLEKRNILMDKIKTDIEGSD